MTSGERDVPPAREGPPGYPSPKEQDLLGTIKRYRRFPNSSSTLKYIKVGSIHGSLPLRAGALEVLGSVLSDRNLCRF
ncbi:hypothetical protein AVEN_212400-1 [Araneus ventricosus]|uniref:Uncharacterized protein n=1 Tax=Araneus ventricosus TaxID=182803 RepID=A0A4Y2PY00_ARAVE|nr:hypothetical protein AVEN_212400-1 [Araneus ventricosus]